MNIDSGIYASIANVTLCYPLELIKTRQQMANFKLNNIKYSKRIYYKGGISLFYKGFMPRLVSVVPIKTLYWVSQTEINNFFFKKNINKNISLLTSSLSTSLIITLVDNPIEIIKTNIIQKNRIGYPYLIKNYGFIANYIRNFFFSYLINLSLNRDKSDNFLHNFIYSGSAGLTASIITQPIDFLKTRKQNSNSSYYKIYKKNNYKNLFKGLYSRSLLNFISVGISGSVYRYFEK